MEFLIEEPRCKSNEAINASGAHEKPGQDRHPPPFAAQNFRVQRVLMNAFTIDRQLCFRAHFLAQSRDYLNDTEDRLTPWRRRSRRSVENCLSYAPRLRA